MSIDWTQYLSSQRNGWNDINRIAGVEFGLMPLLRSALRSNPIPAEHRNLIVPAALTPPPENYLDLYERNFTLSFMRMGTFIRLGSELEKFLRYYFMERMGIRDRSALRQVIAQHEHMVFQRVVPHRGRDGAFRDPELVQFLDRHLSFDVRDNPHFRSVQEVFVHRHLFAHQSGIVDGRYLDDIEAILGRAERQALEARVLDSANVRHVEDGDVYWFKPLEKFSTLIEDSKRFILAMPR